MERPQGESIRVFLDAIPADDAPARDIPGDVQSDVLPEVPITSRQDVPNVPDRAQAMATYNRELIEPLVAALERSQARVGELERDIGRLEAENRALEARTAPQPVEPSTGASLLFLRRQWLWVAVLAGFVVLIVTVLAWPW